MLSQIHDYCPMKQSSQIEIEPGLAQKWHLKRKRETGETNRWALKANTGYKIEEEWDDGDW